MNMRSLAALCCIWTAACGDGQSGPAGPIAVEPPDGAIALGADLYMVPLAEPVDGCPAFRAFSPNRMVVQAIYFRTADGRFVMDRQEVDCT